MPEIQNRPYQLAALSKIKEAYDLGIRNILLTQGTGTGKCLALGTPVLMYDGSIKRVEDIVVGDKLMGPDSTPRRVLSLARGREEMFTVTPVKGDSHTFNYSHVLSLKMTKGNRYRPGSIWNISIADYLNQTKTFKHCAKIYRVPVEFPSLSLNTILDPYFLGIWLGDGSVRNQTVYKPDKEIGAYVSAYAERLGMFYSYYQSAERCPGHSIVGVFGNKDNPLLKELRRFNLLRNKHIPHEFKTMSRENRLQLLAGLVDTDGSSGGPNGIEITSKFPQLADDILFLARSLGFAAYKTEKVSTIKELGFTGVYWRVYISGDTQVIPTLIPRKKTQRRLQKKDVLVTGVKSVESTGVGDYYGFEIDGDRLFLLGDFTVTHNTHVFVQVPKFCGIEGTNLILVHRDSLAYQARDRWLRLYPNDTVGIEMADQRTDGQSYDAIIASVATLRGNRLHQFVERYRDSISVITTDECHHSTEASYTNIFNAFGCLPVDTLSCIRSGDSVSDVLLLGVTATPMRMDRKPLKVIYPHHAFDYPILDAMREGYNCRVRAYRLETNVDLRNIRTTNGDFMQGELEDAIDIQQRRQMVVRKWSEIGGLNRRTIVFCAGKEQAHNSAREYLQYAENVVVLTEEVRGVERQNLLRKFEWGPLPAVLVNVTVATEGTDIPQADCIVLERPTKSSGLFMQMVGRGLRPFDGRAINPFTNVADLRPKDHLILLDVIDIVRKQSDLMTAPRLLGLPDNFDLEGQDLLEARNMLDEILNRDPALEVALERAIQAGEQLPTNFQQLRANLKRIMLFAPSDTRGRAREFSSLAWIVAEERALLEDDAANSNAYVLTVTASQRTAQNEPQAIQVYKLEKAVDGRWNLSILVTSEERTAIEREAFRAQVCARNEELPEWQRGQFWVKYGELKRAAAAIPLMVAQRYRGVHDLAESFQRIDRFIRDKHPSAMSLIDMNAGWRQGTPSTGQIMFCKKNGIPVANNANKGEVSDLITNFKNLNLEDRI